jgi:FkbM family methyltransferase
MLSDLLDNTAPVRLVRARHGLVLYPAQDRVIGRSIEVYGEYYESEVDVFRQILRPGDVAVDVGAFIGTHSLVMARLVGARGRVVSLEAQGVVFRLLSGNLALNGLDWVCAIHAAAGARNGVISVPAQDYSRPGNFGGLELGRPGGSGVPLAPLDAIEACAGARLIKIDVEGMEADVLAGAASLLRRDRPVLYVENDRPHRSPALIDRLRELGYRLFWHIAPFFNPNNFAGDGTRFIDVGYCHDGRGVFLNGFATNMLCVPQEDSRPISGFIGVGDREEHPCKPDCHARLTPGIPVLY